MSRDDRAVDGDQLAAVVRLPQLADTGELRLDATRFVHGRSLPPVPPARPRP